MAGVHRFQMKASLSGREAVDQTRLLFATRETQFSSPLGGNISLLAVMALALNGGSGQVSHSN